MALTSIMAATTKTFRFPGNIAGLAGQKPPTKERGKGRDSISSLQDKNGSKIPKHREKCLADSAALRHGSGGGGPHRSAPGLRLYSEIYFDHQCGFRHWNLLRGRLRNAFADRDCFFAHLCHGAVQRNGLLAAAGSLDRQRPGDVP